MDTTHPNYPAPSKAQLQRESDRAAAEESARIAMMPVAEIMTRVQVLRDEMAALSEQYRTDARLVAAFYEYAGEWAWSIQKAVRG